MPHFFSRIGIFAVCTGLFSVSGAPIAFARQSGAAPRAAAESHAQTVLVFPFENGGRAANLDWLGEGLSELTAERMQDKGASVLSRQDRLATLEKMGLPDSARFSHATLVRIASDADADIVIYGRYTSDGNTVKLEARVMRISPPSLSPQFVQTAPMQDLLRAHARLSWQILCAIDAATCPAEGANRDETSFSDPPASLPVDALENLIKALTASGEEDRLRMLREASRLEPAWDRPPFELGLIYFGRHDCDSALTWFSRVPPNRPDGAEASFDTGVCHLQRNDLARGVAAFSGLLERSRSADLGERLPELPEARNNLGVSRLRQEKWADAEIEFQRAATLDPGEPDYWFNLAISKLAEKQPAAAVAPLESARKLSPDDKDARAVLITVLKSLGRNSDADEIVGVGGENSGRAAPINLQDSSQLVRMARVSKKFERVLLRPSSDPPVPQSMPGTANSRGEGK